MRLRQCRSIVVFALLLLAPVAMAEQDAPDRAERLDIDALKAALDQGATVLLIDVREDDEVSSGSIPGAIHIPVGSLEARMPDIPKDVRLVFF